MNINAILSPQVRSVPDTGVRFQGEAAQFKLAETKEAVTQVLEGVPFQSAFCAVRARASATVQRLGLVGGQPGYGLLVSGYTTTAFKKQLVGELQGRDAQVISDAKISGYSQAFVVVLDGVPIVIP